MYESFSSLNVAEDCLKQVKYLKMSSTECETNLDKWSKLIIFESIINL